MLMMLIRLLEVKMSDVIVRGRKHQTGNRCVLLRYLIVGSRRIGRRIKSMIIGFLEAHEEESLVGWIAWDNLLLGCY